MIVKTSYYTCKARIVPPVASRVEPLHVIFANLGYDPQHPRSYASESEIRQFIKNYGPLQRKKSGIEGFCTCQLEFRVAWDARDARYFTEPYDALTYLAMDELRVNWKATRQGLELHPVSLIGYMGILLARDLAEGFAMKCQNPGCPAPYFVAKKRRGGLYCSHKCANTVAQKRFRERKKKRASRIKKSRRRR
jgi:hypothetical protein